MSSAVMAGSIGLASAATLDHMAKNYAVINAPKRPHGIFAHMETTYQSLIVDSAKGKTNAITRQGL